MIAAALPTMSTTAEMRVRVTVRVEVGVRVTVRVEVGG